MKGFFPSINWALIEEIWTTLRSRKDIWRIVKLHVLNTQHSLSTAGYLVPSLSIINQIKAFVTRELYHVVINSRIRVK